MTHPKVRGLNHLTLAVFDLPRSVAFYRDVLGCEMRALWDAGAYLSAGDLWLCLSRDAAAADVGRGDYTHYAFAVDPDEFDDLCRHVRRHAAVWKENGSEGASLYVLDPDGHKLELHVGTLASRLAHYRAEGAGRVTLFDGG